MRKTKYWLECFSYYTWSKITFYIRKYLDKVNEMERSFLDFISFVSCEWKYTLAVKFD